MLRRGIGLGWIRVLVVGSVLAGGASQFGGQVQAKAQRLDRIVAVVGPSIILESDLLRELKLSPLIAARLAEFTRRPTPQEIAQIQAELRPKILDTLVGDELVLLEAQKYPSLALSDAELEGYLLNIAKGNQMDSVAQLRKEVERTGEYGSWAQYRSTMRRQVGVYKIEVSLVPVPDVTETEIRAHYRELGKGEEAKVQARRWLFDTKQAAEKHLERLKAQPDLEGTEVELSPGSSVPAVEDALFSAKQGDVIGPIALGNRFAVFAVQEVLESKLAPYETVRDQLRRKLEDQRRLKATAAYREQLRSNTHVEIR